MTALVNSLGPPGGSKMVFSSNCWSCDTSLDATMLSVTGSLKER